LTSAQALPNPLAEFKRPTSKGRREGNGEGEEERGAGRGRGRETPVPDW